MQPINREMENKMQATFTTQKQVKAAFWQGMPQVWSKYKGKSQNACPADLRMEFVDFIDMLHKDGHITEELAAKVTL